MVILKVYLHVVRVINAFSSVFTIPWGRLSITQLTINQLLQHQIKQSLRFIRYKHLITLASIMKSADLFYVCRKSVRAINQWKYNARRQLRSQRLLLAFINHGLRSVIIIDKLNYGRATLPAPNTVAIMTMRLRRM